VHSGQPGLGLLCKWRKCRFCRGYDSGARQSSPFDQAETVMFGALEEFVGELAFGLQFAEFGGRFVEEAVGLGAGAVDRFLNSFGVGVA